MYLNKLRAMPLAVALLLSTSTLAQEAVDTYTYKFPYREFLGKSKHKVGEFTEVVHRVGG